MKTRLNRRNVLYATSWALASAGTVLRPASAFAQADTTAAAPASGKDAAGAPFSFDILTDRMRQAAARDYVAPSGNLPPRIANLTYDQHRAIRFRPDHALWAGTGANFQLQAFHLGWLFKNPVRLFEVVDGTATPITFTSADFEYRPPLKAADFAGLVMPGVAGFRLHYPLNRPDIFDELTAFLGASYFRALGRGSVYGLSARGLAVNTASSSPEEFPRFFEFYIRRPKPGEQAITIWAALDSPSVTGAYAFRITPGVDTAFDVTARLFFRADINRLGVAPMTSMFLYAENNRAAFDDYRPQVHDSDGLKIIETNGNQMWRCLNNPSVLANSIFSEDKLAAFGLYQRDRNFADYQDAEARYERRPSLKAEPLNDWGRGSVQLVEIPSKLEINDNIVSFWTPNGAIKAKQSLEASYRLTWGNLDFEPDILARVLATRTGEGGVSGVDNKGKNLRKFVIDFGGGLLENVPGDKKIDAVVNVSRGKIVNKTVFRVEEDGVWRLMVDVQPSGDQPIEINARLAMDDRPVSELWLYQWRVGDEREKS